MKGYTKLLRSGWDGQRILAVQDTALLRRKEHLNHFWQFTVELADKWWFPGLVIKEPFVPHEDGYLMYRLRCTEDEYNETVTELERVELVRRVRVDRKTYLYVVDWAKQQDRYRGGGAPYMKRYGVTFLTLGNQDRRRYSQLCRLCSIPLRVGKRQPPKELPEVEHPETIETIESIETTPPPGEELVLLTPDLKEVLKDWRWFENKYKFNVSQWATEARKSGAPARLVIETITELRQTKKPVRDAFAWCVYVLKEKCKADVREKEHKKKKERGFQVAGSVMKRIYEKGVTGSE